MPMKMKNKMPMTMKNFKFLGKNWEKKNKKEQKKSADADEKFLKNADADEKNLKNADADESSFS